VAGWIPSSLLAEESVNQRVIKYLVQKNDGADTKSHHR